MFPNLEIQQTGAVTEIKRADLHPAASLNELFQSAHRPVNLVAGQDNFNAVDFSSFLLVPECCEKGHPVEYRPGASRL